MPRRTLPLPPDDLRGRELPVEVVPAGESLHRIHRGEHGAIWFGPAPGRPPEFRFDAPRGEYRVCYLGATPEASFVETFLRWPARRFIAMEELAARSLATVAVLRDLRLVSLHGPALVRMGATAEAASGDYALSRAWALALWEHPSAPDGIAYRCRHDDSVFAIALYDRAAAAIEPRSSTPLDRQLTLLGRLARRYGFGMSP
ncbi:MAG TPA: RES family NAD+ phosphorylase [Longimicrobium sp.]